MTNEDHDPILDRLFSEFDDDLPGEKFTGEVMVRTDRAKRWIVARRIVLGVLLGLLAIQLENFALALAHILAVTLIDLEHGLILDNMVLPSIVLLLLLAPFWSEIGITRSFLGNETMLASLGNSFLSGLGAFLVFLIIAMINPNGMGGGDVKFAPALGLMVGFPGILMAIWIAAVSGGFIAIVLILAKKKGRKDSIPFGPFMAIGAAAALIGKSNFVDWYQDLSSVASFT